MSDILTIVLGVFTLVSILGGLSAAFWGARNKTIIATLNMSNAAYKERNEQLEDELTEIRANVSELQSKFDTLLKIKTPDVQPILDAMAKNQIALLEALKR